MSEAGRTDRRSKDGVFGDALVSTVTPEEPVKVALYERSGVCMHAMNQSSGVCTR